MSAKTVLWDKHADIDPAMTKPITGKQYKGTSPNPQHVIWCLTDMFGPVGEGFGWTVVAESIDRFEETAIHWCRIQFWHSDRANIFESYGQTKMAYRTAKGQMIVDDDAPKKSLTDAIVKAASWLGVSANIFLGRWDDQKYVAQIEGEFAQKKDPELVWFSETLPKLTTADQISDLIPRASKAGPRLKQMLMDRANELGLSFSKEAKRFVANSADQKDAAA